ncbi:MAG TPA: hypothetical protein VK508_09370 [Cyclobacteriaceae bacterium]|nr:hypothetical protein [Cyclobacteriaceae bacterium]
MTALFTTTVLFAVDTLAVILDISAGILYSIIVVRSTRMSSA